MTEVKYYNIFIALCDDSGVEHEHAGTIEKNRFI